MGDLDDNKVLVRRFIDEVFANGNKDAVDELAAEEFVRHTGAPSADGSSGRDDLKRTIDRVFAALDDVEFTIDDLVAEGDRIAVRLTSSATQTGEFMGMPATGKRYTIEEMHVFRIGDGQVAEHWHQLDQMGMMRQLGAMPAKG
jgi:steroid delta-isomerase-like uncharacterized protein